MKTVDANTLKKIHDLMRLAGSSNANEAATAYALAQTLLTKHRLTMAEVESARDKESNPVKWGDSLFSGQNVPYWQLRLATGIAKLNGCQAYTAKTSREQTLIRIIGREEDMEIVHYIFDSVAAQTEFLSFQARSMKLGSGKTFYNNFKIGIVDAVLEKLRAAEAAVRKEYEGTTAIVLVDQRNKEVEEFAKKIGIYQVKRSVNPDPAGYLLGKKKGEEVHVSKGVRSSSKKELE